MWPEQWGWGVSVLDRSGGNFIPLESWQVCQLNAMCFHNKQGLSSMETDNVMIKGDN